MGCGLFSINPLTYWGWVMHLCVSKLTNIVSDNGSSPGRRQAIIWTNAGMLLIAPLKTNFSEISIEILTFAFKKMHLKVSSAKWRPFCFGLNVLTNTLLTHDKLGLNDEIIRQVLSEFKPWKSCRCQFHPRDVMWIHWLFELWVGMISSFTYCFPFLFHRFGWHIVRKWLCRNIPIHISFQCELCTGILGYVYSLIYCWVWVFIQITTSDLWKNI